MLTVFVWRRDRASKSKTAWMSAIVSTATPGGVVAGYWTFLWGAGDRGAGRHGGGPPTSPGRLTRSPWKDRYPPAAKTLTKEDFTEPTVTRGSGLA